MVIAGLSTGHMVGLAVMAAVFIAFALVSSFVLPRYRPDFPGKNGLSVFVLTCFVLFVLMIAAVEVFGGEKQDAGKSGAPAVTHVRALE